MLYNQLISLIPSNATKGDKDAFKSLLKQFKGIPFENPDGLKADADFTSDFIQECKSINFYKTIKDDIESVFNTFEKNGNYYSKDFEYKADKDAKDNSTIKVVGLPRTLEDLQVLYDDDVILNFVIKQVIAHSCFSACRKAIKDKQPLTEWRFKLPTERQSIESKKDKKLLENIKSLGLSYDEMLKVIDNLKLQQSQDLLK